MKRWWMALAMAVLAASSVQAMRQAPLIDPPRVVVKGADGQPLSAEQIRSAILSGAKAAGWQMSTDASGALLLSYSKLHKHHVVVRADHDAGGYQLRYVSSANLNHETLADGGALIHPGYNLWLDNLMKHIKLAIDVAPIQSGIRPEPAASAAASR